MTDVAAENLAAAQDGTADAPPPLDPTYLAEGRDFGLEESHLRAIPREAFDRMKSAVDQRVFDGVRRATGNGQQRQQATQSSDNAPPPSAFSFDPFEHKFDPEVADGPLVKNFQEHHKWASSQLDKVHKHYEAQLSARDAAIAAVREQQDAAVIDRFIDSLGPEWSGEFGQGGTYDFDPESREFLKRGELKTAAITAMQIHQANTGRRLPASKALSQALNYLYRDKVAAQERARADAERKKLQAGAADKPRSSGAAPPVSGIRGRAAMLTQGAR